MRNSEAILILSGLSNGQVLQRLGSRGATVLLSGTSTEEGAIQATISKGNVALKGWKKRLVGKVVRGKFSLKLAGIPVGGPYKLLLEAGGRRTEIASFFVGDVWLLAGQSNMEGVGNMTGPARPHPSIHSFSMRREWRLANDPLHLLAESPDICHAGIQCSAEVGEKLRKKAVKGVGVGLFFAREMLKRSGGVPQGLICTAHGGTSMQQWDPAQKHTGGKSMYGSMFLSVRATGQPVAGVLWYQGEGDTNPTDALQYTARMKKLVAASRRDLRQPELPWIMVQIARLIGDPTSPAAWNSIQEQERLLPEKITNFETVAAIDLPLDDCVHISATGFPRLAQRMARIADRMVYKNKSEFPAPRVRGLCRFSPQPDYTVEVAFDHIHGGLQAEGEPTGFRFISPDGTPWDLIYRTELKGNKARLHLTAPPNEALGLFYGYGRSPLCNITDARGFSLPVFGPMPYEDSKTRILTPFVTQWKVTPVIETTKKLDQVALPDMETLGSTVKEYPKDGFVNEHEIWQYKTGQTFFHSRLHLSEPMKLEFLMGYDGPFRLWLNGKPFFQNLDGTNPCFSDESAKTVKLSAGTHELHVGMDLNNGLACGFMLRFARKDVAKAKALARDFVKPTYSAS